LQEDTVWVETGEKRAIYVVEDAGVYPGLDATKKLY
jgi:hypothetical protein